MRFQTIILGLLCSFCAFAESETAPQTTLSPARWMLGFDVGLPPVVGGIGAILGLSTRSNFALVFPLSIHQQDIFLASESRYQNDFTHWSIGFGGRYFFQKEAFDPGLYVQAWIELGYAKGTIIQATTIAPGLSLGYSWLLRDRFFVFTTLGAQAVFPINEELPLLFGVAGFLPHLRIGLGYTW